MTIATFTPTAPTTTTVREDDTMAHIEDTALVNAIRNGQLVEVAWNQLTDDERYNARQAFLPEFGQAWRY